MRTAAAALLIVSVGAAVLAYAPPALRDPLHVAARPVWQLQMAATGAVQDVSALFASKARLVEENRKLENELASLRLRLLRLELLERENDRLSELWSRRVYEKTVLGRVLVKPNRAPYDTLVVDVGRSEGVEVGDAAVASGVVIGAVGQVYANTAVVQLFSAPGLRTDVEIGEQHVPAVAEGKGGGTFEVHLPRDVEVSEGDEVAIPLYAPRVFAKVEIVEVDASDPFQSVLFQSPVNTAQLGWVEILVEGAQRVPDDMLEEIGGTQQEL